MSRKKTVFSSKEVINTFYGENFNEFTNIRTRYHWSGKPYYNILNGCLYKKGKVIAKRDNYLNCVITYQDYLPYEYLIQNNTKTAKGYTIKTPAKGFLYRALRCAHIEEIGSNKTIDELIKASLINVHVAFTILLSYNTNNEFRFLKLIYSQYKKAFKDHKTLVNILKKLNLLVDCEDVVWENVKIEYKDYLHPYQTFTHNITLKGTRDFILTSKQVEEINNKIYWYDNIKQGVYYYKHITWDLFKAISKNKYWNEILRRDISAIKNKIQRESALHKERVDKQLKDELSKLIEDFKKDKIDFIDYDHHKFMEYSIFKLKNDKIICSSGRIITIDTFRKLVLFAKSIIKNNINISKQYLRHNIIIIANIAIYDFIKTPNDVIFKWGYLNYSCNEIIDFAESHDINVIEFIGNRKTIIKCLNRCYGIEIIKRQ